jgi:hypothetical protein
MTPVSVLCVCWSLQSAALLQLPAVCTTLGHTFACQLEGSCVRVCVKQQPNPITNASDFCLCVVRNTALYCICAGLWFPEAFASEQRQQLLLLRLHAIGTKQQQLLSCRAPIRKTKWLQLAGCLLRTELHPGGCAPTHHTAASLGHPFCLSVVLVCLACFVVRGLWGNTPPRISSVLWPSGVRGSRSVTFCLAPPQRQSCRNTRQDVLAHPLCGVPCSTRGWQTGELHALCGVLRQVAVGTQHGGWSVLAGPAAATGAPGGRCS